MYGPSAGSEHHTAQGNGQAGAFNAFEAAFEAGPCPRSSLSAGGAAGSSRDSLTKGSRAAYLTTAMPLSASAELRRARAASAVGLCPGLPACRASWTGSGQRPTELVQSSLSLQGPARVRHAVRMFEEKGCVGSAGQTPPSEEAEASAGSSRLPELLHHWQQVVRGQQQLLLLPTPQQGQQPYGCLTSCCSGPPLLAGGSAGGKGGSRGSTSGGGCCSSRASLVAAFAATAATAADAATEGGQFFGPVLELDQAGSGQAGHQRQQQLQLQPPTATADSSSSSRGSGGSSSCSTGWESLGGSPATPKLQAAEYFGAALGVVAESETVEAAVWPAGQRASAAAETGQQRPRSPQGKLRASAKTHAAVVATATALSALEAAVTTDRAWTAADEAAAVAAAAAWLADPGNAAPARQLVQMAQTQQQHKMQLVAPTAAYVGDDTIDEVQRMAEELLSLCQVAQQSGCSIGELLAAGDGSDGSSVAATAAASATAATAAAATAAAATAAAATAAAATAAAAPVSHAAPAAPAVPAAAAAAAGPEAWQLLAIAAEEVADDDLADELARQVAEMAAAVLKRQS